MRYIVVGLAFGVVWAIMQWSRGEVTEPVALAVPVLLSGAFGALLWGLRALVLRFRGR
jgi:hypothetical protein